MSITPTPKRRKLHRNAPRPMRLEPRLMFDGAAVDTAVDSFTAPAPEAMAEAASPDIFNLAVAPSNLQPVAEQAQQQIRDFINQASADQLFALFNGGLSQTDAAWTDRLESLRTALNTGTFQVNVVAMDSASQFTAVAAYTREGPNGEPTVFINRYWFDMFDTPDATRALVEEFGHAIDDFLNPESDTAGDEGQAFATAVLGSAPSEGFTTGSERGQVESDGVSYEVEFAAFNFVNAYRMVYDLDNDTFGKAVGDITTADIDTNERWADKEQNSHFFHTTGLGAVIIDDNNYNSRYFSGNDVSAIGINIGGQDYFGWVSRPIKSGGVVRGFYFWTDTDFINLATAQADGNRDADGSVLDNKGFLLVVDQAWFNSQIATNTEYTINNTKDGNLGTILVSNVGSSSDRVDSALNALVDSNVAPSTSNDTATGTPSSTLSTGQGNAALEQGYNANTSSEITASINGSGNVLTNDTDGNGDPLSVTTVTSKSTGTSTTATSTGANLVGKYGTLTIKSDGNWIYTPDNTNATVNALLSGNLQEQFTYTASDGKGGTASATLTVQINGSNDAPVAADDYNIAKGITSTNNTGFTATGNVLPNDTDVDTGDGKEINGLVVNGAATVGNVAVTEGATQLIFLGSQGFTSVNGGQELYVSLSGATGAGATYYGVYNLVGSTYTLVNVASKTTVTGGDAITLNADPTHYWNGSSYVAISNIASFLTTYPKVLFENSTSQTENNNGGKEATVSSSASLGFTTLSNLSGVNGTIAVGMNVTGPSITETTKVTEITYTDGVLTSIKLDKELSSTTAGDYSFSGNGTLSQELQGAHGKLTLNSNGSYTYTPTTDNPNLSSGQSAVEVFDYTMQDTAGATSAAKLYITVYGSGSNDPVLVADAGTAYEAGVGRDINDTTSAPFYESTNDNTTFVGVSATGNVLTNDTAGTGGVVASYSKFDGTGLLTSGNVLTGAYGSLTIASTGGYTYTPDNTNSAINALLPGSTLSETFLYKVTNSAGGVSYSQLVITIHGTNDLPVAVADTATASEDGILNATGNVLTNDTDVDAGDSKTVSRAGTSSANTSVDGGTTSANGLAVIGTYGTLTIGADGTYSYVLNNSAAAVQSLTHGQVENDVFAYEVKDTNGATSTTTLTITVTGANETPINQINGTEISSTSSTSVTTAANTAIDFTGTKQLSVADADTNLSAITLEVEHGTLSFTSAPVNVTMSASSGSTITISTGSQAQLNAALALLRYTPDTDFYGTDFLSINSVDSNGARDIDGIAINIPTNTAATVSEPALSSGSNASSTAETYSGTLTLASGQIIDAMQTGNILDGSNNDIGDWQVNTDGTFSVTLAAASSATSTSFSYVVYDSYGNAVNNTVTVTITDDTPTATANTKSVNEGNTATGNVLTDGTPDTFGADGAKTTSPTGGVVGIRVAGADTTTAVITGTGSAITGTHGTLTLAADGSYSYVAGAVTGNQTDVFVYTIEDADGDRSTATLTITIVDNDSADTTPPVITAGQTFNYAENQTVNAVVATVAATDAVGVTGFRFSNGESTTSADGFFTIAADGKISITAAGIAAGVAQNDFETSPNSFTYGVQARDAVGNWSSAVDVTLNVTDVDDTAPVVTAGQTFSYAENQTANAVVATVAASDAVGVTGFRFSNGESTTSADGFFTIAADGKISITAAGVAAGVAQNDFETGLNSFTYGIQAGDAAGSWSSAVDVTLNVTDDVQDNSVTVTSPTVNEASPHAVFTVTGTAGQNVTLALTAGTATGSGTDFGSTGTTNLQVSLDNGVTWTAYTAAITTPAGSSFLVRTPIIEDGIQDNGEQFTLTATPVGGTAAVGTATINDEGQGDIFKPDGSLNTGAVKSDDRPLPPVIQPVPPVVFEPPIVTPPQAEPAAPETTPPVIFDDGLDGNAGEIRTNPSETTSPQETSSQSEDHELRLNRNIPDQALQPDGELQFTIPADTFTHTDAQATVILNAAMVDGSPLPSWLSFIPNQGQFSGTPPANFNGEIQIKVTARDDAGRQAETIVRIAAGSGDAPASTTPTAPSAALSTTTTTPASNPVNTDQGGTAQAGEVRTTSGFPVQVATTHRTGVEHELLLGKAIPDQLFPTGASLILYIVPTDAFVHTDSLARVELFAQMVDGTALPSWLAFDKEKGEFKGVPPANFQGELLIKVIARDGAGRQAETIVRIRVGEKVDQLSVKGKPTLTAQLKEQSVFAWKAERDNLVKQAREASPKAQAERLKATKVA